MYHSGKTLQLGCLLMQLPEQLVLVQLWGQGLALL